MNGMTPMSLGRDKLAWSQEIWNRIDQAVHDEAQRTKIAAQFLPLYPVGPDTTTVPTDAVDPLTSPVLSVNEADTTRLLEIWADFALTKQQYEDEERLMTAVTLAINAANKVSRAEDLLILQGRKGFDDPLFQSQVVNLRGSRRVAVGAGTQLFPPFDIIGLLPADADQTISVDPTSTPDPVHPAQNRYGENTFEAVSRGYSLLQKTHYGRQALVLPTSIYADTYAPLATTLIMPADRIKGLVDDRFYGTSSLPDKFDEKADPPLTPEGVQVALDGNTMDLVVGMDTTTAFMQVDIDGLYRFRVFERFTLRLKDRKAVVELDFLPTQSKTTAKKPT
jgi:uncharacterized linocin/CFP29 family protein